MSRRVQIRNVPDALHRKLKARAADSGHTLSDYLLAELERVAGRPTRAEMLTRLHSRKRVTLKTPAAVVIREERGSRRDRGRRVGTLGVSPQTPRGARVEARLFRDEDELHAPHLLDVEVVQGLRRLVRTGEVSSTRADEAIID
jgi:plasmid stability protein